ncbi:hypothetical protein QQF64_036418, partial [Cirrhinus molitorella]
MVDLDLDLNQGNKDSVKRKWSEEEVGAVEKHLMHFINSCRVPGKKDCVSCLLAEPQALKNKRLIQWRSDWSDQSDSSWMKLNHLEIKVFFQDA